MFDIEPILAIIKHYHPSWEAPTDNGRDWVQCLCAWHLESRPSAAVSFKYNAYRCLGCDAKGDIVALIRREEGISYQQAVRRQQELLTRSDDEVSPVVDRVSRRGVPEESRSVPVERTSREVPSRVRGGPTRRS